MKSPSPTPGGEKGFGVIPRDIDRREKKMKSRQSNDERKERRGGQLQSATVPAVTYILAHQCEVYAVLESLNFFLYICLLSCF